MAISAQRATYRPSGNVDWARFLPWSGVVLLAAISMAGLLHLAFIFGLYLIVLIPLAFAAGLGGLAGYAVTKGHCRNTAIALLLGLSAALIMYFGFYYISMLAVIGVRNFERIDLLPRYVQLRMATDIIRDTHSYSQTPRMPTSVDMVFNWITFSMEAIGVPFLVAGIALVSVRRAYCEKCGAWKESYRAVFPQDTSRALVEALNTGRLLSLAEIPTVPASPNTTFAVMQVETCCSEKEAAPACPHYFSIGVLAADKNGVLPKTFGLLRRRPLLYRVELSGEELSLVAAKFPKLRVIASQIVPTAVETSASGANPHQRDVVEEMTVPPPHCGAALPTKVALTAGFLELLPALMMPVGLFGALGCAIFLDPGSYSGTLSSAEIILVWMGIVVSLLILMYGVYFAIWNGSPWTLPYLLKAFRRGIANRPDRLVDPDDDTARLVEICPRAEWNEMTVRNTNEIGLLKIDLEQRVLLFEGNKQRFRVPVEAITSCEVEKCTLGSGHSTIHSFLVVVRAKGKLDCWETPLLPKRALTFWSKSKLNAANALWAEISRLIATSAKA